MVIDIARSCGGGSIIGTVRIGDDSVQIVRCMGYIYWPPLPMYVWGVGRVIYRYLSSVLTTTAYSSGFQNMSLGEPGEIVGIYNKIGIVGKLEGGSRT